MPHNMTVTIEDPLWKEMRKHNDIRWSAVMKESAKEKLKALEVLDRLANKTNLSENDIREMSIKLGKKISNRG